MRKALKFLHLLGFAVFLGSIPGHIVLGRLAGSASSLDGFAILQQAKHTSILALTLPGLTLIAASGLGLLLTRRELLRDRWMRLKLGLALLVVLNGVLVLSPIGAEIARLASEAAASGVIPPALSPLEARESSLGAANVLISLAIVALAVARPRLRASGEASAVRAA
jgi:hypothetical protein